MAKLGALCGWMWISLTTFGGWWLISSRIIKESSWEFCLGYFAFSRKYSASWNEPLKFLKKNVIAIVLLLLNAKAFCIWSYLKKYPSQLCGLCLQNLAVWMPKHING